MWYWLNNGSKKFVYFNITMVLFIYKHSVYFFLIKQTNYTNINNLDLFSILFFVAYDNFRKVLVYLVIYFVNNITDSQNPSITDINTAGYYDL